MVQLADFKEKVRLLNLQASLTSDSITALGALYNYVNNLGWLNRLWLKLRIRWAFPPGQPRDGYLDVFTMHYGIRKVLRGGGTVHADERPKLRNE